MSDVFDTRGGRGAERLLKSVHTPDYLENSRDQKGKKGKPKKGCIINPDLSRVEGVPRKYWKIHRGKVLPMTANERAAVDAKSVGG